MEHRRSGILGRPSAQGLLCVLLTLPALILAAQEKPADQIRPNLLPAPHQVEVRGAPTPIQSQAPQLIRFFPVSDGGFDPLSPLSSVVPQKISEAPTATKQSVWAAIIVDSTHTQPRADAVATYAAAAGNLASESYVLQTSPEKGVIAVLLAGGPRGLLYGAQTLAELAVIKPGELATVQIQDGPDIASREVHIHGFDRGYGAGDLKSIESFRSLMPSMMPSVAAARFNLFRLSLDAGWINNADRWCGGGVDDVMKSAIADAHHRGVDVLIEIRLQGQDPASTEPKLRPMNPMTEWDRYESALRRALSWGPDVIDFSCNDLGPLRFPEIKAKYGIEDGRFSGVLMADLLKKVKTVIDQTRPGTKLRHLPRFYGEVYWQRRPQELEELFSNVPRDVPMYASAALDDPKEMEMRRKYGASFACWVNYSSNHAKEMRVILDAKPRVELEPAIERLPFDQRNVLINLGYPVEPQRTVILATGEWLWNAKAYDRRNTLARAARKVWGADASQLFMQYDDLLDYDTTLLSLGGRAADMIVPGKVTADEEVVMKGQPKLTRREQLPQWNSFVSRATQAAAIAEKLQKNVQTDELKKVADILYWNARRVELDSKIGVLIASADKTSDIDVKAIESLLQEHEAILRDHYRIEKNDPKSAEVVTRGIRRIREALKSIGAAAD